VRELLDGVGRVTGRSPAGEIAPRRPGDAPTLVSDNAKAERELG